MAIIIHELEHRYEDGSAGEKVALHDVNIKIEQGEMIGLIGHTGSGKSTLIQHLNGLLKPTSGAVFYDGKDINDSDFSKKKLRSKVGLVFQYPEYQLFESTVIDDVKFGPKNIGMDSLKIDMNSFQALKQVGIGEDLLDVSPLELSGGQKRRVAIAGVLAMEPEVLILDEPTAGLDPSGRDEILDLVAKLHKERNLTVILVSHSMEDVANYVERIIVMNKGKVMFDDVPHRVFSHVKELEAVGLAAPQVTYILHQLKDNGFDVDPSATTIEEAKETILQAVRKNSK